MTTVFNFGTLPGMDSAIKGIIAKGNARSAQGPDVMQRNSVGIDFINPELLQYSNLRQEEKLVQALGTQRSL